MSYIWQDFNIKTFEAETVVFRDGVFCPELSTLESPEISSNYDLPIHFIYIGEISGENCLNIVINENVKNQVLYLSAKVKVKKNATINININNNGFGSDLRGFFIIENHGDLKFNLDANHLCKNTGIFIKTKILSYKNTSATLSGVAHIYKYCDNCKSDINFSAMIDKNAKIIFSPVQRISAIPESASHSASIAQYNQPQIEYLYSAGLTSVEVKDILREAFMSDIDIFEK